MKYKILSKENIINTCDLLSNPGNVFVYSDDLKTIDNYEEIIINPGETINIKYNIKSSEIINTLESMCNDSNILLTIQLRSCLAQAGLSLTSNPIINSNGIYSQLITNYGPFIIIIPSNTEIEIGKPYLYNQIPQNYNDINKKIKLIREANINNRNEFEIIKIKDNEYGLGIKMNNILIYKENNKEIVLNNNFPGGTERRKLHKLLNIEVLINNIENISKGKYDGDIPYSLMQTIDPIIYPINGGVIMTGGATTIKENGEHRVIDKIIHGPSNLGQYRKSNNNPHTLIAEFICHPSKIANSIKNNNSVFMITKPIELIWI